MVVALLGVAAATGPQSAAARDYASASTVGSDGSDIGGWDGSDPTPVGLGAAADGSTAVFTSQESGTSLWVADQPTGQPWGQASQRVTGIDAGSAAFAENASGAAILAWDAPANGTTQLSVSLRSSWAGEWSAPSALAADDSAGPSAAVGIDASGAAMVAYVHDQTVYTQRFVSGTWTSAVQHGEAPVRQLYLGVSTSGNATIAWTQDTVDPDPTSDGLNPETMLGAHWLEPSDSWGPDTVVFDRVAQNGLLGLSVNDGDLVAIPYFQQYDADGTGQLSVVHTRDGSPDEGWCWPNCAAAWTGTNNGNQPDAAVSDDDEQGTLFVNNTYDFRTGTYILADSECDGLEIQCSFSDVLATSDHGDAQPRLARNGDRVLATWLTHTDSGDVLNARGIWSPGNLPSRLDIDSYTLGHVTGRPALAVTPGGDGEVLWSDTGDGSAPAVLRFTTVAANQIIDPDRPFAKRKRVPVHWSSAVTDDDARYDVRTRYASARHGFGRPRTWQRDTRTTASRFRTAAGRTVCFSTRVHRSDGKVSAWSPERCTATAVDDASLHGRGWTRSRSRRDYEGSLRTASRKGTSLSLPRVRARSIALLVSRRRASGKVTVRLGSRVLGTFDTSGRRADKKVIRVASWPRLQRGRLRITVVSRGLPVAIDGVFLSAQ